MSRLRVACLAASSVLLAPAIALGQATFSIPNPLIKREQPSAIPTSANTGGSMPRVTPVSRSAADGPHSSPLPPGGASGAGLAPIPAPTGPVVNPETAVRDELSNYTVTAVVGDLAVMRTNVGGAAAVAGAGAHTSAGTPQGANSYRQQMLRVKSGSPLSVGGMLVVPTVQGSAVQFRSRGESLLYTVYLDSNSSPAYVPTAPREAVDPAIAARAAPRTIGAANANSSAAPGQAGVAQPTQR
jgi:hypothetical protein